MAWYCAMRGGSIVRGCSISGGVRIIVDLGTDLIAFSPACLLSVGGGSSGGSVVGVSSSCYTTLLPWSGSTMENLVVAVVAVCGVADRGSGYGDGEDC